MTDIQEKIFALIGVGDWYEEVAAMAPTITVMMITVMMITAMI